MFPRPEGKKPSLDEALEVLADLAGEPVHLEHADDPLLDHLLLGVLAQHTTVAKAKEALRGISAAYLDLNELRVSGKAEIQKALEEFVPAERLAKAAWDLRMALQDVYDVTHGLDLEPLRGRDPEDLKHFATRLPNTAGGPAALLFQLAVGDKHLALGVLESRLLERLGFLPRAATPLRVRQAVERLIKPAQRVRFAWVAGATARLFERDFDPAHPFCKLLVACRAKELVEREKAAKAEEVRRKAEEKRLAIEEAKRVKLEAIERKKREAEEKKKAIEVEKKRKKDEALKALQQKKLAEQARRLEEKRKQEESKRAALAAEKAKKQALEKAKAEKAKADKAKAEKAKADQAKAEKAKAEKAKADKAKADQAKAEKAKADKAKADKAKADKERAEKAKKAAAKKSGAGRKR